MNPPGPPLVIIQDQSGSMAGAPDQQAKDFCEAALGLCRLYNRDLVVIQFAHSFQFAVARYPQGYGTVEEIATMNRRFFGGGTDLDGLVENIMHQWPDPAAWRGATVILLTDEGRTISKTPLQAWRKWCGPHNLRTIMVVLQTTPNPPPLVQVADMMNQTYLVQNFSEVVRLLIPPDPVSTPAAASAREDSHPHVQIQVAATSLRSCQDRARLVLEGRPSQQRSGQALRVLTDCRTILRTCDDLIAQERGQPPFAQHPSTIQCALALRDETLAVTDQILKVKL